MADTQDDTPVPYGAQVMRKMYAACKSLHAECLKAIGSMDDSDAKASIGEHLDAIGGAVGGMQKSFGKLYKGLDLEEQGPDKKPDEVMPGDKPADPQAERVAAEEPVKETEQQIKSDDSDEDDGMAPAEKSMLLSRLRQLETKIRHKERLQRVARSKAR